MGHNKLYYLNIVFECCTLLDMSYDDLSMDGWDENINAIDKMIECVSDVFCQYGLNFDSEPNAFGLQLEETIDYLNSIRFSLIDKGKQVQFY